MPISRIVGLTGVHPEERPEVRRLGGRVEMMMVVVAIIIPLQWYAEAADLMTRSFATWVDWFVWAAFLVETVVVTSVVEDRWRYLRQNWMNLLIIVTGCPVLWTVTPLPGVLRNIRLLLLVGLLLRFSTVARHILAQNRLGGTVLVAVVIALIAGVLIAGIDPNITSAKDGVWWALVTMSTVGYGDIVPASTEGRAFAVVLILCGLVIIALLTANISAFLVDRSIKKGDRSTNELIEETNERLERVEQQLEALMKQQSHNDVVPMEESADE